MKNKKLLVPILAGLIVGQIFAEGDRPFSVSNTLRFGYDDNLYRAQNDPVASAYIEDLIDLAFTAALSDRTDLVVKSQLQIRSDEETRVYPSLYALLSHSPSPRTLLRFSEYFRSADRTAGQNAAGGRYKYYDNRLGVVGTYVLNEKNRLELSLDHSMRRHEKEIEDDDSTTIGGGISWAHDISPQRTSMKLNLRQHRTVYDKRDQVVPTATGFNFYDSSSMGYDATEATVELNHTFNPQWVGTAEAGVTYVQPDLRDYTETTSTTTNFVPVPNEATLNPLFALGLTYSPSPRTRVTGNYLHRYDESIDSRYGGQTSQSFTFGIQHDVTAKLMAKALARFSYIEYAADDSDTGDGDSTSERMDLDFRLTYKLNRINFLEMGVRHRETTYNDGLGDYTQNMIDVGWRVEL